MFEYDVALSFAGEQRSDVLLVAECLKQAGVSFFYDDYEKANLWGKNLYDHLSEVYQNKARYCVIFASKEYAEKTWPNLERQNAQSRALKDKGIEYILPVRFDSTEIPGLLPTIGYLDYKQEGASGICSALLSKLGRSVGSLSSGYESLVCSLSPRVLITPFDGRLAVPEAESCVWGAEISISVRGSDNDSFFSQLREERPDVLVAYGFDVAMAKPITATRQMANSNVTWNLIFAPKQTNFYSPMEAGSGSISADQFAEMRVRRLLLNEFQYQEDEHAPIIKKLNDASHEVLLRGLNQSVRVDRSRFPELFSALNSDPRAFLETAWIIAVADLKRSASVEVIERLTLRLVGTTLDVEFSGRRHRKYVNVDPYEISVHGKLELTA
ncbi:MAG: TIR domain-containing protein [Candidatus Acidiferrum sp.]